MSRPKVKLNEIDLSVTPFYAALKRTWAALCATTSIHGLKFTQDRDTNKKVRSIWMFIVLLSFIAAISTVYAFYLQYRDNITRMTIENYIPIATLTFPAVTICPEAIFNIAQTKRYLSKLKLPPGYANMTKIIEDLKISYRFMNDDIFYFSNFTNGHNLSSADFSNVPPFDFIKNASENLQSIMDFNNISSMTFMGNSQWNCDDILLRCRFQKKRRNCRDLFQRSKSAFGFCCSFNLNQVGLNYSGYGAFSSITDGLSVIIYYNDTDYGEIPTYSNGFILLITQNDAFPSFHAANKFITLQNENFVNMRPTMRYCSKSVKKLELEERQCVLPNEFPLKHFKNNIDTNCEIECRIDKTIQRCGCVPYFFQTDWTQERICSFKDIPCLLENFSYLVGRYQEAQCNCPPNCNSLEFSLELTNAKLSPNVPAVTDFYEGITKNYGAVHIFIDSQVFPRFKLDLVYNKLTLISNLGSAFSLFLGMSMVSIIEIIYYITIVLRKFYKQEVEARRRLELLTLLRAKARYVGRQVLRK